MPGFAAIGDVAIGALPDEGGPSRVPLASRLLAGEEVETVIVMEVVNTPIVPRTSLPSESTAIGALAIGDAPDLLAGAGAEERLFLGDGLWCGRPDDFGAAHLEAEVRLVDIGEFQEEIPYLPEQDRRATASAGAATLANADGRFDDFFGSRSVDAQRVRAWLTDDRDGYTADWIEIMDTLAEALDPELDDARLSPLNVATLLEAPALRSKYEGLGGATGDERLKGKYIPLVIGDCFNVEPDLESFEDQIDRWNEGALSDITAVKDGAAPLLWDGVDHADYSSLKNAVVAPGFFTKALAIGRTKRGAGAAFRITGDVSGPYGTTAAALLAFARGAAGLPEELIDAPSFGVLPTAPIDLFLKGDRSVSVAEIFDALLRPFNGWYGALRARKLRVGIVGSPVPMTKTWTVESHEIFENSLSVRKFETPPRWRVGVTGVRNWTPMTADELVDWRENPDVSQAEWERLQRTEELAERSDAGVKLRHRGALDHIETYGAVRGYFTNFADAQAAADSLFLFLSRPMRRVDFETGFQEIFTSPGAAGTLTVEGRLQLDGDRPALVTRRIFKGDRRLGFSCLAVVDEAA